MLNTGFKRSENDCCPYLKCSDEFRLFVLLYVDDLLILGTNATEVNKLRNIFNESFDMTDLGIISDYLGINVS